MGTPRRRVILLEPFGVGTGVGVLRCRETRRHDVLRAFVI
jgi:hypothetical protein